MQRTGIQLSGLRGKRNEQLTLDNEQFCPPAGISCPVSLSPQGGRLCRQRPWADVISAFPKGFSRPPAAAQRPFPPPHC